MPDRRRKFAKKQRGIRLTQTHTNTLSWQEKGREASRESTFVVPIVSAGRYVAGRYVAGRYVAGRYVAGRSETSIPTVDLRQR